MRLKEASNTHGSLSALQRVHPSEASPPYSHLFAEVMSTTEKHACFREQTGALPGFPLAALGACFSLHGDKAGGGNDVRLIDRERC